MRTLSPYFFMEVIVKKLHANVDKYATLNASGDVIHYTEKSKPKFKRTISLAEGERIFTDLYGHIGVRWIKTEQYRTLQARKDKSFTRKGSK